MTDEGANVLLFGLDRRVRLGDGGIRRKFASFNAALEVGK
jgi:hypothetical protein